MAYAAGLSCILLKQQDTCFPKGCHQCQSHKHTCLQFLLIQQSGSKGSIAGDLSEQCPSSQCRTACRSTQHGPQKYRAEKHEIIFLHVHGKIHRALKAGHELYSALQVSFEPPRVSLPGGISLAVGPTSSVVLSTTYLDERVRLGRGGRGSSFVFTRGGVCGNAGKPSCTLSHGWLGTCASYSRAG